jgi:1-acyl-sn-glycerol-3-phosphate acyltransferase
VITLLRSVLFSVVFFGGTFLLCIAGTVVAPFSRERLRDFALAWARLAVWSARVLCGIRLEVSGLENLPAGPALIASRHQSAFDTMVWFTLVPRCCYVMKQELLRIPLMGRLIGASGMIAIDRDGGARTIRTLIKEGRRAVAEGKQIVIFPEGTRAEPGALLPLQSGVAALSAGTGLPVIPVITDSGLLWGRRAFHKYPGTVHIVIRPALPLGLHRDELMRRLRHELESEIPVNKRSVDKSVGQ